MSLRFIAIGGGGHLRVLLEIMRLRGIELEGIVDADPALVGHKRFGVPVLGDDAAVLGRHTGEVRLINGIGSTSAAARRGEIFAFFKTRGYKFLTLVHPSAVIAGDVVVDEGVQIMAGVVIQPGVTIGANTIVNTRSSIDHDCCIGPHVHLAPGVILSGGVTVEIGAHIGTAAAVIQRTTIGAGATVAAGACVIKAVRAGALVRGVPAQEAPR